ncbi:MAG: GNAT family N-acetyltransferase [Bacteroidetes bacterium HGW-Bacteroidetes-2]|jgi:GNAT superfamily N-acetyltransferase|nr:MAG: GNAT family N-acetyltransferase [Bacteroidetes bacterium HGW-Bacteroidetes-2]
MNNFTIFTSHEKPDDRQKKEIIDFLHTHLGAYGDPKAHILKCLQYALGEPKTALGGFALLIKNQEGLQGITIVNQTGMSNYIPENILVYIAVHKNARGKGIGKQLMQKAIELSKGSIALHVEPDNPAKFLYENLGFENRYLEMRLKK